MPDEEQEKQLSSDLKDEMELLQDATHQIRVSGIGLGLFCAAVGWYFSLTWGIWALIIGIGLGAVLALGMGMMGGMSAATARKYRKSAGQDDAADK